MKRAVSLVLTAVLVLTLILPVGAAEQKPTAFSDLPDSHWGHKFVMPMVAQGLFRGTTAPVNGVADFSPDRTMTRAEFLAVVTRHLYADELAAMEPAQPWYANNYQLALDKGLITAVEMPVSVLEEGIPRQEMAMILVCAAASRGEEIPNGVPTHRIADYEKIDSRFTLFVRRSFAMGMLKGHDAKGTFAPKDTVTRAEGAVALCRLVNPDMREPEESVSGAALSGYRDGTDENDYKTDTWFDYSQMYQDWAVNQQPITITYGQVRYNRPAVEGDIYVRKDGNTVILRKGPCGIVGEGQGLMADLGLIWGSNKYKENIVHMNGTFQYDKSAVGPDQPGLCSTGNKMYGQIYRVNRTTGEGHFEVEWFKIMSNPEYLKFIEEPGTERGQVSQDPMHLWVWVGYTWDVNFTNVDPFWHQTLPQDNPSYWNEISKPMC